MKSGLIITGVLLLAVLLFPPVDHVVPGTSGYTRGSVSNLGTPERRFNHGFVFIGDLETTHQIRLQQWLIQLVGVLALGTILVLAIKSSARTP